MYKIVKSEAVLKNRHLLIKQLRDAHTNLGFSSSTEAYHKYNIFGSLGGSRAGWHLYRELVTNIKRICGGSNPIWMQAWLNFDMPNEVLDWHTHEWMLHGYVSIDCKKTRTIFRHNRPEKGDDHIDYAIDNEDGNIYIGPGNRWHKVEVLESYETPRITIAFDVTNVPKLSKNLGLMPVV